MWNTIGRGMVTGDWREQRYIDIIVPDSVELNDEIKEASLFSMFLIASLPLLLCPPPGLLFRRSYVFIDLPLTSALPEHYV